MNKRRVKRKTEANLTERNSGATNPVLLDRYDALGMPSREFERVAGIPYKFVDSARSGKMNTAKAAANWKKFESTLSLMEQAKGKALSAPVKPAGAGPNPPERTIKGARVDELEAAIEAASTPEACNSLINRISKDMLREVIDVTLGNALINALKEKRQYLELQMKHEEKARAGEPLTIEVRYVNSWRQPEVSG